MLSRLLRHFEDAPEAVELSGSTGVDIAGRSVRVALANQALRIDLGEQRLDLHPEPMLTSGAPTDHTILAVDPDRYFSGTTQDLRLQPGRSYRLDPEEPDQRSLYSLPDEVTRRRLSIVHDGSSLVIRAGSSRTGSRLTELAPATDGNPLRQRRERAFARVMEIYGGGIARLSSALALQTLLEVNDAMRDDPYAIPRDGRGHPGGLLELDSTITPIFIGDLHGRVDNLLTVLTSNGCMETLDSGDAALIFLGDAVHSDDPSSLEEMDGSMLVMDLVFRLKQKYPRQVFFLLGNHDSFSPEVMKGGIAQGLIWEKALVATRGQAYRDQMLRFYEYCPLVAHSTQFCACHAGPPRATLTHERLIDIKSRPGLAHEITWTRCATPGFPQGYGAGEIRRMRKALGLAHHAPFIVGHYPRSENTTFWLDSDRIEGHHVLFSARDDAAGMMTLVDGRIVAQAYPVEPLSSLSLKG